MNNKCENPLEGRQILEATTALARMLTANTRIWSPSGRFPLARRLFSNLQRQDIRTESDSTSQTDLPVDDKQRRFLDLFDRVLQAYGYRLHITTANPGSRHHPLIPSSVQRDLALNRHETQLIESIDRRCRQHGMTLWICHAPPKNAVSSRKLLHMQTGPRL